MATEVYACICAAVTERQVRTTILTGARSAEEIGERCGAGTGCGSCLDHLDELLEESQERCPLAANLPRSA